MTTATTTDAVYRAILAQLQAAYAAAPHSMDPSRIYMASDPFFEDMVSTYVQLVPGTLTGRHNESGTVGLVEEEFTIVCWARAFRDTGKRATELLSLATQGVLSLVGAARQTLMLNQLGGLAAVPITLVSNNAQLTGLSPVGWVAKGEVYSLQYKLTVTNFPT